MTFIPDHTRCTTTCVLWPNIDLAADFSPFWVLCSSHSPKFKIYSSLAQTLPFFIAFFVNIMLYVRIIHGLNLSFEKSTLVDKKDQNIRLRNQVAWMLIVNGSVFFLCLAPFEIISLLQGAIDIHTLMDAEGELYGLNSETLDIFGSIFKPFSYLNSVVNPVIYIAMSSRYREAFKSAFAPRVRRLRYRKSNQNGSPTSTVTTFLELCRERESKVWEQSILQCTSGKGIYSLSFSGIIKTVWNVYVTMWQLYIQCKIPYLSVGSKQFWSFMSPCGTCIIGKCNDNVIKIPNGRM